MPREFGLDKTRNIGIGAHIDAGKTTTTERIRFYTGKAHRMGADFYRVIEKIRERLGANVVPVQIPVGAESEFLGVVDLIRMKAILYTDELGTASVEDEIPADLRDLAIEYRERMIEAAVEGDD